MFYIHRVNIIEYSRKSFWFGHRIYNISRRLGIRPKHVGCVQVRASANWRAVLRTYRFGNASFPSDSQADLDPRAAPNAPTATRAPPRGHVTSLQLIWKRWINPRASCQLAQLRYNLSSRDAEESERNFGSVLSKFEISA